jgi:DNA-directed RNA polymerase specialized sigma24 family protein
MRIRRRRGFDFSLDAFAGTASSARRVDIKCHRPAPDDQYLQHEIAQMLVEGLAGLSPKLASVVTLHYFEELSTRECAEILAFPYQMPRREFFVRDSACTQPLTNGSGVRLSFTAR